MVHSTKILNVFINGESAESRLEQLRIIKQQNGLLDENGNDKKGLRAWLKRKTSGIDALEKDLKKHGRLYGVKGLLKAEEDGTPLHHEYTIQETDLRSLFNTPGYIEKYITVYFGDEEGNLVWDLDKTKIDYSKQATSVIDRTKFKQNKGKALSEEEMSEILEQSKAADIEPEVLPSKVWIQKAGGISSEEGLLAGINGLLMTLASIKSYVTSVVAFVSLSFFVYAAMTTSLVAALPFLWVGLGVIAGVLGLLYLTDYIFQLKAQPYRKYYGQEAEQTIGQSVQDRYSEKEISDMDNNIKQQNKFFNRNVLMWTGIFALASVLLIGVFQIPHVIPFIQKLANGITTVSTTNVFGGTANWILGSVIFIKLFGKFFKISQSTKEVKDSKKEEKGSLKLSLGRTITSAIASGVLSIASVVFISFALSSQTLLVFLLLSSISSVLFNKINKSSKKGFLGFGQFGGKIAGTLVSFGFAFGFSKLLAYIAPAIASVTTTALFSVMSLLPLVMITALILSISATIVQTVLGTGLLARAGMGKSRSLNGIIKDFGKWIQNEDGYFILEEESPMFKDFFSAQSTRKTDENISRYSEQRQKEIKCNIYAKEWNANINSLYGEGFISAEQYEALLFGLSGDNVYSSSTKITKVPDINIIKTLNIRARKSLYDGYRDSYALTRNEVNVKLNTIRDISKTVLTPIGGGEITKYFLYFKGQGGAGVAKIKGGVNKLVTRIRDLATNKNFEGEFEFLYERLSRGQYYNPITAQIEERELSIYDKEALEAFGRYLEEIKAGEYVDENPMHRLDGSEIPDCWVRREIEMWMTRRNQPANKTIYEVAGGYISSIRLQIAFEEGPNREKIIDEHNGREKSIEERNEIWEDYLTSEAKKMFEYVAAFQSASADTETTDKYRKSRIAGTALDDKSGNTQYIIGMREIYKDFHEFMKIPTLSQIKEMSYDDYKALKTLQKEGKTETYQDELIRHYQEKVLGAEHSLDEVPAAKGITIELGMSKLLKVHNLSFAQFKALESRVNHLKQIGLSSTSMSDDLALYNTALLDIRDIGDDYYRANPEQDIMEGINFDQFMELVMFSKTFDKKTSEEIEALIEQLESKLAGLELRKDVNEEILNRAIYRLNKNIEVQKMILDILESGKETDQKKKDLNDMLADLESKIIDKGLEIFETDGRTLETIGYDSEQNRVRPYIQNFGLQEQGKVGNQNFAKDYITKAHTQTLDVNMGITHDNAYRMLVADSVLYDNSVAAYAFPEEISSSGDNEVGNMAAVADRAFNFLVQLFLAWLGVIFDYGHPTTHRTHNIITLTGFSANVVSEDYGVGMRILLTTISVPVNFAGMVVGVIKSLITFDINRLKSVIGFTNKVSAFRILRINGVTIRKGRERTLNGFLSIYQKFSSGAPEIISTYSQRLLNKVMPSFAKISAIQFGTGFFFQSLITAAFVLSSVFLVMFLGVSIYSVIGIGVATTGLIGIFSSFVNSFQAIVTDGMMEYGKTPLDSLKFIGYSIKQFITMIFGSYLSGVMMGFQDAAKYIATGRGDGTDGMALYGKGSIFDALYDSTYKPMFNVLLLSLGSVLIFHTPAIIFSALFIFMGISVFQSIKYIRGLDKTTFGTPVWKENIKNSFKNWTKDVKEVVLKGKVEAFDKDGKRLVGEEKNFVEVVFYGGMMWLATGISILTMAIFRKRTSATTSTKKLEEKVKQDVEADAAKLAKEAKAKEEQSKAKAEQKLDEEVKQKIESEAIEQERQTRTKQVTEQQKKEQEEDKLASEQAEKVKAEKETKKAAQEAIEQQETQKSDVAIVQVTGDGGRELANLSEKVAKAKELKKKGKLTQVVLDELKAAASKVIIGDKDTPEQKIAKIDALRDFLSVYGFYAGGKHYDYRDIDLIVFELQTKAGFGLLGLEEPSFQNGNITPYSVKDGESPIISYDYLQENNEARNIKNIIYMYLNGGLGESVKGREPVIFALKQFKSAMSAARKAKDAEVISILSDMAKERDLFGRYLTSEQALKLAKYGFIQINPYDFYDENGKAKKEVNVYGKTIAVPALTGKATDTPFVVKTEDGTYEFRSIMDIKMAEMANHDGIAALQIVGPGGEANATDILKLIDAEESLLKSTFVDGALQTNGNGGGILLQERYYSWKKAGEGDKQGFSIDFDNINPGGHGTVFFTLFSSMIPNIKDLLKDNNIDIRNLTREDVEKLMKSSKELFFGNGDGLNSAPTGRVGAATMTTVPRTDVDAKGGMIVAFKVNVDGKDLEFPYLLERGNVSDSNKLDTESLQALFARYGLKGITKKQLAKEAKELKAKGKEKDAEVLENLIKLLDKYGIKQTSKIRLQAFNTNGIQFNNVLMGLIFVGLMDILGEKETYKLFASPTITSDKGAYTKYEWAIGQILLWGNMNLEILRTQNPQVNELLNTVLGENKQIATVVMSSPEQREEAGFTPFKFVKDILLFFKGGFINAINKFSFNKGTKTNVLGVTGTSENNLFSVYYDWAYFDNEAENFVAKGDISANHVIVKGNVELINESGKHIDVSPELLASYPLTVTDGKVVLENVKVVIDKEGNVSVSNFVTGQEILPVQIAEEAAKTAKATVNTQATAQKFAVQAVQTDNGEIVYNNVVTDRYVRASKIAAVPGIFVSKQGVERIGKEGTELKVTDSTGKEKILTVRNGKLVTSTGKEFLFKFNAVTRTDENGNVILEFRLNDSARQIFDLLDSQTQQELTQAAAYSLSDRLNTDMQIMKQLNSNNKINSKAVRSLAEQMKKNLGTSYTDAEKDMLLSAKLKATTFAGTKDTGLKITNKTDIAARGRQLKKAGVSKVVLSKAKKIKYSQDQLDELYYTGEQVIISVDENELDNVMDYLQFNHLAGFRITSKAVYDKMLQQGLINAILEQGKEVSYVVSDISEIDLGLGNGKVIFVVDPTNINLTDTNNVKMLQDLAKMGRISLYYDSDKELTEQQQQDIKTIFKDCKTMVSVGKAYITNKFSSLFNKDIVSRSFEEGFETDLSDIFRTELKVEDVITMIKPLLSQKNVSFDMIKNLKIDEASIFTQEMMERINAIETESASEKVSALRQFVIGALIKYVEEQVPAVIASQKDKFDFEFDATDIDTMNKQSRQQIDYRFIQLLMTGKSIEQILAEVSERKLDGTKTFADILKIANDDVINKKWNESDMIIDPLAESEVISAEEAIKALLMDSIKVVDVMNNAFNLSTEGIKGILASA
ncbi:MAG: hypothetical protein K5622_01630 [Endomicrobiaceae bacterium]|nr:hypothetical protein [Endomicrobiaceae bacterium]